MAKTTAQASDEFLAKLALTDTQQSINLLRRSAAAGHLDDAFGRDSDMPLLRTKLIGSAARNVMIRPVDDIDMMAEFENKDGIFEKYRYDSQAFLYRVKYALSQYSVKIVGARGQAVRLFYADAPHVDIAPVFKWGGGDGTGYGLPNGTGGWLTTDPDHHEAYMSQRDSELGSQLKPLVRMLKRWNNVHGKRLKSWHLEVVAASVFGTVGSDLRQAGMYFFDWARNNVHVNDPAQHGGDLSTYLTTQGRQDVITSLTSTFDKAARAVAAEQAGNHEEAIRLWRIIYGDEFPAYG
jgi:hypothetical protein